MFVTIGNHQEVNNYPSDEVFANSNIIFIGDLHQMTPIKGDAIYKNILHYGMVVSIQLSFLITTIGSIVI